VKGEILELKNTVNTMVDQLGSFASEVTRVAREVGTEGKLGGQAKVERRVGYVERFDRLGKHDGRQLNRPGAQHRRRDEGGGGGRSFQKITVDVKGEILELKDTINTMVDQLSSFAAEVTRVAREEAPRASSVSGRRAGRRRYMERLDRLGELDGG